MITKTIWLVAHGSTCCRRNSGHIKCWSYLTWLTRILQAYCRTIFIFHCIYKNKQK